MVWRHVTLWRHGWRQMMFCHDRIYKDLICTDQPILNFKNHIFQLSNLWPLTYDLDHRICLRYCQVQAPQQISGSYVKQFSRESVHQLTVTQIHRHTERTDFIPSTADAGGNNEFRIEDMEGFPCLAFLLPIDFVKMGVLVLPFVSQSVCQSHFVSMITSTIFTLKASANKIKILVSLIWIPHHLTYFGWTFAIEVCQMMGCSNQRCENFDFICRCLFSITKLGSQIL